MKSLRVWLKLTEFISQSALHNGQKSENISPDGERR